MGFGLLLASLGISLFDIISLMNLDIKTCNKIKKILESYDYKIISKKNIRKEIWNELFKDKKRIYNIDNDDIEFFYELSLIPGTNILSMYQNIIKNSEIKDTYKLCVDKCIDDEIINSLINDKYIIKNDDMLEKNKSLTLKKKEGIK